MSGGRIVYSSTGTAPIVVTPYGPGLVSLDFEDGSGQVYRVSELLSAFPEFWESTGGAVDVEPPAPEWPEVTQAEWERECDRAYRAALGDVEPAGAGGSKLDPPTASAAPSAKLAEGIEGPAVPRPGAVPQGARKRKDLDAFNRVPGWANVATSSRWEAGERGEA